MDTYVTNQQCKQTESTLRGRIRWLMGILLTVLAMTGITAQQAWQANASFDTINGKLERHTGLSDAEVAAIQRSLDRIDRRLDEQQRVLTQILRNHTHETP